jgi:hypothetical protein
MRFPGDYDVSDAIVAECYARADRPEDKAKLLVFD